jgi:hypothetical protein
MAHIISGFDYSVPKSLTEEPFWPEMLENLMILWRSQRGAIKEFAATRNIDRLCHFTAASNLNSLFEKGITSRKSLNSSGTKFKKLDPSNKVYFEDFSHVSVSLPNTKMLYNKYKAGSWIAIIVIDVRVLWKIPFFSIPMNSAKGNMHKLMHENYHDFLGLDGFKKLFSNVGLRKSCSVPKNEPTDIQSEIIFLKTIPTQFFKDILLSPIDKTSEQFLDVANQFGFFETGARAKYQWKWLSSEVIEAWGPTYSTKAQENYNSRVWHKDWRYDGE